MKGARAIVVASCALALHAGCSLLFDPADPAGRDGGAGDSGPNQDGSAPVDANRADAAFRGPGFSLVETVDSPASPNARAAIAVTPTNEIFASWNSVVGRIVLRSVTAGAMIAIGTASSRGAPIAIGADDTDVTLVAQFDGALVAMGTPFPVGSGVVARFSKGLSSTTPTASLELLADLGDTCRPIAANLTMENSAVAVEVAGTCTAGGVALTQQVSVVDWPMKNFGLLQSNVLVATPFAPPVRVAVPGQLRGGFVVPFNMTGITINGQEFPSTGAAGFVSVGANTVDEQAVVTGNSGLGIVGAAMAPTDSLSEVVAVLTFEGSVTDPLGQTFTSAGDTDLLLVQFQSAMTQDFGRHFGGTGRERAQEVAVTPSSIFVAGTVTGGTQLSAQEFPKDTIFLAEFNRQGMLQRVDFIEPLIEGSEAASVQGLAMAGDTPLLMIRTSYAFLDNVGATHGADGTTALHVVQRAP